MGRAERRMEERMVRQGCKAEFRNAAQKFQKDMKRDGSFDANHALNNPAYMAQVIMNRAKQREEWNKNGISHEDLKREYDRGYRAAMSNATEFFMDFFYAGTGIALHNICGFGEMRIKRVLDELHRVMGEEITGEDIVQRLKRETGLDIRIEGYAKEGVIT